MSSRDLKPGVVLRWCAGKSVTLKDRKADDSGWWLEDNQGGLADFVIDDEGGAWKVVPTIDHRHSREQLEHRLTECRDDSLPWQYFNRITVESIVLTALDALDSRERAIVLAVAFENGHEDLRIKSGYEDSPQDRESSLIEWLGQE